MVLGKNCCDVRGWTGGNLIDYFLKQKDTGDSLLSWSVTSPTGFGVLKCDTSVGDVIITVLPRHSQRARVEGSDNTCHR